MEVVLVKRWDTVSKTLIPRGQRTKIKKIFIEKGATCSEDLSECFSGFINLEEIGGLENLDTSNVTNMRGMFLGASSLVELDLSSFDTSNVTEMAGMFDEVNSLKTVYLNIEEETIASSLAQHQIKIKQEGKKMNHYDTKTGGQAFDLILPFIENMNVNNEEAIYVFNVLKYLYRYKNKNGIEDLTKAVSYLEKLREVNIEKS